MTNTSTIRPLNELIVKAFSVICKGQKRTNESCIYDSIKKFLENCDIDDSFGKEWSNLKRVKIFIIKKQKMEIRFIFRERSRNCFFSNSLNTWNKLSKQLRIGPQDLQGSLSIISKGIDSYISSWMQPFSTLPKNQQQKKKIDKQQQMQNIKYLIWGTLQDIICIFRTKFANKRKTITILMVIIGKITTGPSNVQAQL